LLAVPESVQNDFKASDILANEARADISCRGFWQSQQRAFFDVKITNLLAPSFRNQTPNVTLSTAEKNKNSKYKKRVMEVDHGEFTPFIFVANGGVGRGIDFLRKIS